MRRISFHTGPFRNSRCRLDDLADSNSMAMSNAFQDVPRFGLWPALLMPLDIGAASVQSKR